ncbi:MAG: EAL domain-containing protein [Alphaproteobacteria bacterium]
MLGFVGRLIIGGLQMVLWGCTGLAAAWVLVRSEVLAPETLWIAAPGLGLLTGQASLLLTQARERRRSADQTRALRRAQETLADNLELVRAEMAALTYSFESSARHRTQRLVSEMHVLEGLIERLNEPRDGAPVLQADENHGDPGHGPGMPTLRGSPPAAHTIQEALEDNRIDLHLQPVVSLPQRRVRCFEALTRLRTADGRILLPGQYLPVAEAAGFVSAIDNLLLLRTVQIARRLPTRERHVLLMCNISAGTLKDIAFFDQFVDFISDNPELTHQIVFEFSQQTIEHAGPDEMRQLSRLTALGFRLSMDQVQDLSIDPHYLGDRNFRFLKIPAPLLLDPAQAAFRDIDPSDVKAQFQRRGIDLIVDRIEDERTVVEVLEYNVDFGQGFLFGAPQPVEAVVAAA